MAYVVGNRDKCGRCGTRHGGNDHYCPVHGGASEGCCEPTCNKDVWEIVVYERVDTPDGRWPWDWQSIRRYSIDEYRAKASQGYSFPRYEVRTERRATEAANV